MSWDASLYDDRGHLEGDWNYTHNCNGMANAVLDDLWVERDGSWWKVLDGMDGAAGAGLLRKIIDGLRADPERFLAMQPENGWGNYDSFLELLVEMCASVPEWPCKWEVSG